MPLEDIAEAIEEVWAHEDDYADAKDLYDGNAEEAFVEPRIAAKIGGEPELFNFNFAGRVVDARLELLKIASVTVPDDDAANAALQQIWEDNELGKGAPQYHLTACSQGDVYGVVEPDDRLPGKVVVHRNDPDTCRVFYDPLRPSVRRFAAQVWKIKIDGKERVRVNLFYVDRVERWISGPETNGKRPEEYIPYEEGEGEDAVPAQEENEHGRDADTLNVFHWRNQQPYGVPEHLRAKGPQNLLNKINANFAATLDTLGFPQRVALREATLGQAPADFLQAAAADGTVLAGAVEEEWDHREVRHPGTTQEYSGVKDVKQFPAADTKAFTHPFSEVVRYMGELTATPMEELNQQGTATSGESYRQRRASLYSRVGHLQTWFGDTWREMLEYALHVAGFKDAKVSLVWQPVQLVTDKESIEGLAAKVDLGVPRERVLQEAGYLDTDVEEWSINGFGTNLGTRIDQTSKIADVALKLGQAAALGTMPPELAARLVADLVGDAEREGDDG